MTIQNLQAKWVNEGNKVKTDRWYGYQAYKSDSAVKITTWKWNDFLIYQ